RVAETRHWSIDRVLATASRTLTTSQQLDLHARLLSRRDVDPGVRRASMQAARELILSSADALELARLAQVMGLLDPGDRRAASRRVADLLAGPVVVLPVAPMLRRMMPD